MYIYTRIPPALDYFPSLQALQSISGSLLTPSTPTHLTLSLLFIPDILSFSLQLLITDIHSGHAISLSPTSWI